MRGRYIIGAIVLGVSLGGVASVQSDITPVNYPTPTPPGYGVYGVITNIDPVNHMIQVREASGMVETIHITENIQVLRNGALASFNTLTLGDTVAARAK